MHIYAISADKPFLFLAKTHDIPNNIYKIGQTIENTTGGGLNGTFEPESEPTLQNIADKYPVEAGKHIIIIAKINDIKLTIYLLLKYIFIFTKYPEKYYLDLEYSNNI